MTTSRADLLDVIRSRQGFLGDVHRIFTPPRARRRSETEAATVASLLREWRIEVTKGVVRLASSD